MFDRLLDLIVSLWDDLMPFTVIEHYNRGVRLRFGKPKGLLEPGFHFKIPFADQIMFHMIKTTTMSLSEQTITTKDWKSIVVKAVIKYEVEDPEQLLLEVNDPIDAIADMTMGVIRNSLILLNWDECNNENISNEITKKARVESRKWGIRIQEVTLTDLGEVPSFRLFNSTDSYET